jgi:hypothetical protein
MIRRNFMPFDLQSDEYFIPVEVVQEKPLDGQGDKRNGKIVPNSEFAVEAVRDEISYVTEADQVGQHVDGDGIHSDHHKKESPLPVLPDIDKPVKKRQEQEAETSREQYIRGVPQVFDDREPEGQKQTGGNQDQAGEQKAPAFLNHGVLSL